VIALAALLLAQPAASRIERPDLPAVIIGRAQQGELLVGSAVPGSQVTLDGKAVPVAPDGRFIIGLDRDHGTIARLVETSREGARREIPIDVQPRAWNIEHVNVARRPGGATEAFLARREPELARIVAARAVRSAAGGWRQQFVWPARGRISGRFGAQRVYRGEPGSYHNGVDVAAGAGAPVVAPADGVVVLAADAPFSLEGNLVIVDHGHGLNSAFLHLSRIDVREGQIVRQGEPIGTVGATGRATGPHLHWALTWNGARLDPERVAGAMK
jgi:murein DD-endopeptidase MepM/ murein hydrolase activator NlpD